MQVPAAAESTLTKTNLSYNSKTLKMKDRDSPRETLMKKVNSSSSSNSQEIVA
jgi:hypothetical protein